MKSKIIALSAISSALSSIFLIIGYYFELADVFAVIISSCFTILPLYYKSYKGCFLSALSSAVISFICSGFNIVSIVLPSFLLLFAFFPTISCLMSDKLFKKIPCIIFKIIWFVLAFYGIYFYFIFVMNGVLDGLPLWLQNSLIYFVGLFAIIFCFVYDRFIVVVRKVADFYFGKILK